MLEKSAYVALTLAICCLSFKFVVAANTENSIQLLTELDPLTPSNLNFISRNSSLKRVPREVFVKRIIPFWGWQSSKLSMPLFADFQKEFLLSTFLISRERKERMLWKMEHNILAWKGINTDFRGRIVSLKIDSPSQSEDPILFQFSTLLPSIQTLIITNQFIHSPIDLTSFPENSELRVLVLKNCSISGGINLTKLPSKLKRLDLTINPGIIDDIDVYHLPSTLEYLGLWNTSFTPFIFDIEIL